MGDTPRLPIDESEDPLMQTTHYVALSCDGLTDDEAKAMIVDHVLAMLPDAHVAGPPVVSTNRITDERRVGMRFTSKAYDLAATAIVEIIMRQVDELLFQEAGLSSDAQDLLGVVRRLLEHMAHGDAE